MKPEVLLEDWIYCKERLYGRFHRHAVIPDGTYAHTSRIIDRQLGFAESENTLYALGAAALDGRNHRCWYAHGYTRAVNRS